MADNRDDPAIYFVDPEERGVIPLDGLHVSKSLRKKIRKGYYQLTFDKAFREVMIACAEPMPGRAQTWINDGIKYLYGELFDAGFAHSVEIWNDEKLAGGLYGVSIGGAFFGESMFSRFPSASKIALYHLVERLNQKGFVLLDTQFVTDHLLTMGGIEIPRLDYQDRLARALKVDAKF